MEFVSYQKIGESLEKIGLAEAEARALSRAEWIASEKIHGANFCVMSDGHHVECAKRKATLDASEFFFGYREVVGQLVPAVLELAAIAAEELAEELAQVSLFGELFGGGYPHPEVPPVDGVEYIQTGVAYSPGLELFFFDVELVCAKRGRFFLDFDDAQALVERVGLMWNRALVRGSLTDVMCAPVEFSSTIPRRLGLPELDEPNLAEGLVIRPARERVIETDAGPVRPLIKRKIASFSEDRRFHQARDWSKNPSKLAELSGALDLLEWEGVNRINSARIQAAVSKIGRPTSAEDVLYDEVVEEVLRDVFEELRAGFAAQLLAIDAEERALLDESLRAEVEAALA